MPDSGLVARLAQAVSDGEPVAWSRVRELARSPEDRSLVAGLEMWAARAPLPAAARVSGARWRTPWYAALSRSWAALLILSALAGVALDPARLVSSHIRPAQAALMLAFAGAAIWLAAGGRGDRRTRPLMDVYLLCGAALAHGLLRADGSAAGPVVLPPLGLEALLPCFLWRFAELFPRVVRFTRLDRLSRAMAGVSLAVGLGFVALHVARIFGVVPDGSALETLTRQHPRGWFWDVVYFLFLPGFLAIVLRARAAAVEERQRVMGFALALAAGMLPLLVVGTLQALSPSFAAFMASPRAGRYLIDAVVLSGLGSIPLSTAYFVLVGRLFVWSVLIGRAARYALARASVTIVTVSGIVLLGSSAYWHRDRTLGEIAGSASGTGALILLALAVGATVFRETLLRAIDRWFLAKPGSEREILVRSTERLRQARGRRAVAGRLVEDAQHAFGSDTGALLLPDAGRWTVVHGVAPDLEPESALAAVAAAEGGPVDLAARGDLFTLLPAADREWLVRARCELLVPIARPDGGPGALLALGRKSSGLPYDRGDRLLLDAMAAAASLALSAQTEIAATGPDPGSSQDAATECADCRVVHDTAALTCSCGRTLRPALLPRLVAGKFRVERILGTGGMGVVYGGRDLDLQRSVALKTLPRMSPDGVDRIRAEAQAMAAVSHAHLAVIYGIERWLDRPVLVVEHLEGGTLAERIRRGPLDIAGTLRMGLDLADAVAALHGAGILHRDIKPSNIGFSRSTVKLLDFGIARLVFGSAPGADEDARGNGLLEAAALAGTPAYLSPEALAGAAPDPRFDLWSLGLVMFEAMAGVNPFAAGSLDGVRERLALVGSPDLLRFRSDAPREVAVPLATWLAREPSARPQTADEFRRQLAATLACLEAGAFGSRAPDVS